MPDLVSVCRIIDGIRDISRPAKTLKELEQRFEEEQRAKTGARIGNVSACLAKISRKLYGSSGCLIGYKDGSLVVLEEGDRLYRFASIVVRTMRQFQADTAGDYKSTLRVYSASAFAAHFLPRLLRPYLANSFFRYVWLYERTQVADILQAVGGGLADIGICIDWPGHNLYKTELARAGRGILAGEEYLRGKSFVSRASLSGEVVITYQPNTLQRIGIDDAFPEPAGKGVRIYAETENVIYGWVANDAAIGHGYVRGMREPAGTKFILQPLMENKPEVCWCAYTPFDVQSRANDDRQKEVAKVVRAMKKVGLPAG